MEEEIKEVEEVEEVVPEVVEKPAPKEFQAQIVVNEKLAIRWATNSGARPAVRVGSIMVLDEVPEKYVSIVLTIARRTVGRNGILVIPTKWTGLPQIAGSIQKNKRNKRPEITALKKAKDISVPGMAAFIVAD